MEVNFAKLWQIDRTNRRNQQKFWDSRADEFNSKISESKTLKETEEVINYLQKKGAIESDGSILDIGCGPGKYALEFAKKVEKVTGTDISSKMLTFAEKNAHSKGIDNIEFIQTSWPEADLSALGWIKNFDLVFASFCPGIDSAEALEKIVKASHKHCFISGFVTREDRIMDRLKRRFGIKVNSWGRQIYYSFNLLWNWGYYPEITYQDRYWHRTYDIEQFADTFLTRLNIKHYFDRSDIISYLKEFSVDGKIEEQTTSKVARLYWQV